ncbi:MAG: polyprenyl synthetase family protein [Firmicutes bacterium]|nr:polyprenyl synthetase family protein [Bacillota bacterium]
MSELYSHLGDDLGYVEQRLQERLHSPDRRLEGAATHLLTAGGKRLRPVFVLLAGQFGDYDRGRLGDVAVALELIHMATLVHDDVIDHADTRRGQPTVKAQFGNQMAMVAGDYIFAQALETLARLPDTRAHRILSRAIWRMVEGEIEQIRDLFRLDQTLLAYLRRIRRKTALLIEMSCTLGAMATGADTSVVRALRRYGYGTGMAFQVIDDILDFTATEERLGKPVGNDLRQGNLTAPVLFAMRDPSVRKKLEVCLGYGSETFNMDGAIELVRSGDGVAQAQRLATSYLIKARASLAPLADGMAKDALLSLADFVGQREY